METEEGHSRTVECEIRCEWDADSSSLKFVATGEVEGQTLVDRSQYIKLVVNGSVLTVEMSVIGAEELSGMRIAVAEYNASGRLIRCRMVEDAMGVSEYAMDAYYEYAKVFFLKTTAYVPVFMSARIAF